MKHRWQVLLVLGVVAALVALGIVEREPGQPVFDHRGADRWARDLGSPIVVRRETARRILIAGGPRAVPVLVRLAARPALAIPCQRIVARIGPDALPLLATCLKQGPVADRIAAAELIGRVGYGSSSATRPLLDGLRDSAERVRAASAHSLGGMASSAPGAIEGLRAAMRDPDPGVRYEAAWAWWRTTRDPDPAIPVFVADLENEKEGIVRSAIALEEMGPRAAAAVPSLLRILDRGDAGTLLRSTTVRILYAIGPAVRPAVPALERLLAEVPPRDPAFLPSEWRRLVTRLRLRTACALLVADPHLDSARQILAGYRKGGDSEERVTALDAMWRANVERNRVLAELPSLLVDPAARIHAARLTAAVGPPALDCVPALISLLREPAAAGAAALALGNIGPGARAAVPALERAMSAGPVAVRPRAALALYRVTGDDRESLPVLLTAARSPAPEEDEIAFDAVVFLGRMARTSERARCALRHLSRNAEWPVRLTARRALDLLAQKK